MSRFQFHRPSSLWFPESLHHCTLVTDNNQKPVPARMSWTDDLLSLDLLEDECGRVHTMVPTVRSEGTEKDAAFQSRSVLLATPWLFPKLDGYRLEIELLRGLVSRLKNATEMWQANQIALPDNFENELSQATKQFITLWHTKDFASIEAESFDFLLHLLQLSRNLSQVLLDRQGQDAFDRSKVSSAKESGFVLGANIQLSSVNQPAEDEEAAGLRTADLEKLELVSQSPVLDTVGVRQAWKPIPKAVAQSIQTNSGYFESITQKLRQARKRPVIGPVFDISRDALPAGQTLERDGEELRSQIVNSMQLQLPSVATETNLIHVVGGINGIGVNGLTPTIQSQIVIDALETANTIAPYTQLMISFDQPYCERHAWSVGGQTPEFFLTKLAKQRTPLHAIGLEINLGFFPRGTLPRTDLDWIMLLHSWVIWEVPIYVLLRVPNEFATNGRSKTFSPYDAKLECLPTATQSAQHLVKLFSSLPWIQGVIFQGLTEADTHFQSAQLLDPAHADFKELFCS